jgi:hypothetical protein
MRSFLLNVVGAAILGASAAGCGQPVEDACPRAIGTFQGTYTVVNGNCAQLNGRPLMLNKEDVGNTTSDWSTLSDKTTTEVTLVGCMIGVTQRVTDPAGIRVFSQLQGELMVEDASALSGLMSYSEFAPDGATLSCQSEVQADYRLAGNGSLGAAAGTVLGQ